MLLFCAATTTRRLLDITKNEFDRSAAGRNSRGRQKKTQRQKFASPSDQVCISAEWHKRQQVLCVSRVVHCTWCRKRRFEVEEVLGRRHRRRRQPSIYSLTRLLSRSFHLSVSTYSLRIDGQLPNNKSHRHQIVRRMSQLLKWKACICKVKVARS